MVLKVTVISDERFTLHSNTYNVLSVPIWRIPRETKKTKISQNEGF